MKKDEIPKGKKLNKFNKKIELSVSDISKIFSKVDLFSDICEDSGIIKLAQNSEVLTFTEKNIVLMEEGDIGSKTYIILTGDVEILVKSLSGDIFVVAVIHADKNNAPIVGENALLNTAYKRSATVRTLNEVRLLAIENKTFVSIIKEYPHIGVHVYRKMCQKANQRLTRSNKDVATLFNAYVDEMLPEINEEDV